ncbi:MAG: peptide transporter substrate-binding protein, partial [Pseudonocardiales bacterium]|nr:peptide transporter substrate-binding protein [Pseudonocardiales bacterium]
LDSLNARRRSGPILAVGAALTLFLAACGGGSGSDDGAAGEGIVDSDAVTGITNGELPSDGPPELGGILRIPDASDAPTLDPHKSPTAFTQSAVSGLVYSKLVTNKTGRDIEFGSGGLEGDLAKSWESSADGKTWTFILNKGVKWQNVAPLNGREFTSADVACTVNRIKNLPGIQSNLMTIVDSVDSSDPYKVAFKLSIAFATFDETMANFYMSILPCEGTSGQFDLSQTAIGTGPFILQKWDRKVQRTYVKNPNYFVAGKPYLDEIHVVIMADPASQLAALRTGELDIAAVSNQLYPSLISTNPNMVVRNNIGLTNTVANFNMAAKPFDDVRVRRAVSMAWDRDGMSSTFLDAYKLSGPYPAELDGGMSIKEQEEKMPYDPAGAKKLLAEAGFPDGLSVELLTTDGYGPIITNGAQWLQQDLKEVGINATLKVVDYATYWSTMAAKDYTLSYAYTTAYPTADEWLNSLYVTGGPKNAFNISDPKLDAMVKEQRGILDNDERVKKLEVINDYIVDKVVNPLMGYQAGGYTGQQTYVHNFFATGGYERPTLDDVWLDSSAPTRK